MQLLNEQWKLKRSLTSKISNEKIESLNESILSQTIPGLDSEFNYTSHLDLTDDMAKDGKLPIDFDYRYKKKQKTINKNFLNILSSVFLKIHCIDPI